MSASTVPALGCVAAILLASAGTRLVQADIPLDELAKAIVPPAYANLPDPEPAMASEDRFLRVLQERDRELDLREAALADREAELSQVASRARQEIARLEAAEAELRETLALARGAADADVARLVTMYESMRPATAAALFESMAPEFAAGFLMRMVPETAGAIMSELPPEIAYALSAVMAGRHGATPR